MKRGKTNLNELMPRVSIWRRGAAFLIDILIIYIAVSPLSGLLSKELNVQANFDFDSLKEIVSKQETFADVSGVIVLVSVVMSVMALFYWSALEYLLKQSVGKMLMKIEVRSTTKDFKLWQVIIRNITKAMSITSLSIVFVIDAAYIFFNKNKQRLTELLSKTEVAHAY